ncbi:MAG: DUF4080 domain-containing protein [Candidatus Cloacimonas sp.]|jgi:anaerobic magnesium-protoporphyrin IX monomethyl ester cyclase|nr:DUF4080 domain-containing protein [Candidatus Cloacimonas sp.]
MKKILLVAINSSWSQSNLALFYLREMLSGLSYQVIMRDFTLKDYPADVMKALYQQQPDIICFSAYIWNREYLQKLIPELKKLLPQAIIVLGGPETENLIPCLDARDFYIIGSGEAAFRELAKQGFCHSRGDGNPAISHKLTLCHFLSNPNTPQKQQKIQGWIPASAGMTKSVQVTAGMTKGVQITAEMTKGATHYTSSTTLPLKQIPFPYHPSDKAQLQGKLLYYECYRGCPYNCVYCLSANDFRTELRFDISDPQQLQKLYTELDALIALEPKTIKFIDRSFNIFPALAHKIWAYFISSDYPCEVHFEIYPDLLSEADFSLLETAPSGRIRFEIGIQSTSDSIALNCGRKSTWKQSKQALLQLKKRCKLRLHADLISGLPGETYESVLNSINQLCACLPDAVQLGTLKILPDTPMQHIAQASGYLWLNDPPYQCLASDAISYPQMCTLESLARILNLYWNKEEYTQEWQQMLMQQQATDILFAIMDKHQELGYELHSLAKGKRDAVMAAIYALVT